MLLGPCHAGMVRSIMAVQYRGAARAALSDGAKTALRLSESKGGL